MTLRRRKLVIENANRMITVRPLNKGSRRKLEKFPVFLYNSGPETQIKDEYKHKVTLANFINLIIIAFMLTNHKSDVTLANFINLIIVALS